MNARFIVRASPLWWTPPKLNCDMSGEKLPFATLAPLFSAEDGELDSDNSCGAAVYLRGQYSPWLVWFSECA